MFHAIRTRINATSVVAVLALVFAMTGGAYAAKKYLITSTSQIKPSVLAQLKGKSGLAGPAGKDGANGAAGSQGEKGPQGPVGNEGKQGPQGTSGSQGQKGETGSAGSQGTTGAKGTTGATGAGVTGPEGVCSTANCILPKGVTLKGDYSVMAIVPKGLSEEGTEITEAQAVGSVSFGVQLAATPEVHYIRIGETPPAGHCTGTAPNPGAVSGNLCVFAKVESNNSTVLALPMICSISECGGFAGQGADRFGFGIETAAETKGLVGDLGTWAVTG